MASDFFTWRFTMSTWLYQLNQTLWPPPKFRTEIWEKERWSWTVGRKISAGKSPEAGDTVVFFCAPTGGHDPGFYALAVVVSWVVEEDTKIKFLDFRPTAPSDRLKMCPWADKQAMQLADKIRGTVKQGTLFLVDEALVRELRMGINAWLGGKSLDSFEGPSN